MVTKKQINLDQHPLKCHNFTHYQGVDFDPDCKEPPKFKFKGAAVCLSLSFLQWILYLNFCHRASSAES